MVDLIAVAEFIKNNPMLLGLILTIVYNLAGYIASMAKIKGFEPYDKYKFLQTLAIFEGLFIGLQGIAGLDPQWVALAAIIVAVLKTLKSNPPPIIIE